MTALSRRTRRVDFQVSVMMAAMVIVSCLCVFFCCYLLTYETMIHSLTERVEAIYGHVEEALDKETFHALRSAEDVDSELYRRNHILLDNVRMSTGVRYLYTATRDESGRFIYLLDGLPPDAEDFRRPGDVIEAEILPELETAMSGQAVLPHEIKDTGWGKIFISYLPVHDGEEIVGVVGVEFEADMQYNTYRSLRLFMPLIILAACGLALFLALYFFRRISNPSYRDLANTDQLTQLKSRNAFTVDLHNWEASRDRLTLGILLADLNDLKKVNDGLGHERGDAYICLAAQALTEAEPSAVAYRVGGDEFALLVPYASEASLSTLGRRIDQGFERIRPDWAADASLSLGWALYDPAQDADLQSTFRRADEAMYQKKRAYHDRKQEE